jgi:hypothetical protein
LCSKYTNCTCADRDGSCSTPQQYAKIIYELGYRKVAEESEAETAIWEFKKAWTCNNTRIIEDATCSRCGYMRHTVRISQGDKATTQEVLSKLGKYCPNCRSRMSVDY